MNNKTRGEKIDKFVQDLVGNMISDLTIEGKKRFIQTLLSGFVGMSFNKEGVEKWFNDERKIGPDLSDCIKDRETFTVKQLVDKLNLEGIKIVVGELLGMMTGVYK